MAKKNTIEFTFNDEKAAKFNFTAKHPVITFNQYPLLHTIELTHKEGKIISDPSQEEKLAIHREKCGLLYQEANLLYDFICKALQSVNHNSDDIKTVKVNKNYVEWKVSEEHLEDPMFRVANSIDKIMKNTIYQNDQYEIDQSFSVVNIIDNNAKFDETNIAAASSLNGDCIVWESLN